MQYRRVVLVAITALVVVYSLAVFYHVRSGWELGIRCRLATTEDDGSHPLGPTVGFSENVESAWPVAPRSNDRILSVAGQRVPSFLHLERRLEEIAPPREVPGMVAVAQVDELSRLPRNANLAQVGDERWVKVDFLRPLSDGSSVRQVAWLRLQRSFTSVVSLSLAWFVLEMIILSIGALVVARRPGDPSATLFFVLCAVNVVTFMAAFHWPHLVGSRLMVYPFVVCAMLLVPMTLHFYILFPRPLGAIRRWTIATLVAIYIAPAAWMAATFYHLLRIAQLLDHPDDAAKLNNILEQLAAAIFSYLAVCVTMLLLGCGMLVYRYLHSRTAAEQAQVRWLLGAAMLAAVPIWFLLRTALHDRADFAFGELSKVMAYGTSLILTLAYAVSITRYKLMQVGRLVNRGILYVGISFAATVLFCLLVGAATAMVGTYYFRWENALAAGLTAMVVVVLLGLVRDRVQRALDQRFYREKYRLDRTVRELSAAVDQLVEPAELARQLVQAAREAVGAVRGAAYLRDVQSQQFVLACRARWAALPAMLPADSAPLAALGAAPAVRAQLPSAAAQWLARLDGALACRLEAEGQVIGAVLLGPKEGGAPYTPEDTSFLQALVRTTTLALRSAQGHRTINSLKEDLRAALEKTAEQQRRIMFLQSQVVQESVPLAKLPRPGEPQELRHGIVGASAPMAALLAHVAKVARSPSSVLLRGESGTGKELLARAVHENSPRADGPFVSVHCAALSAGLLESELFGHVRGAFTGADRDKVGRFELANRGTLFLDEIGDISLETQTKLLRVLQERSFERVGGLQTIHVDVRLITATHQNLEALIRAGRFREDLFYRLNVISLAVPPLREREQDVLQLAWHFLRVHARRAGKAIDHMDDAALEALAACSWPGNVRQLENAIERAVVLAEGRTIRLADLPAEVANGNGAQRGQSSASMPGPLRDWMPADRATAAPTAARRAAAHPLPAEPSGAQRRYSAEADDFDPTTLDGELLRVQRERLNEALAACGGNKSRAARLLGIPRSTLFSRMRRLGMEG